MLAVIRSGAWRGLPPAGADRRLAGCVAASLLVHLLLVADWGFDGGRRPVQAPTTLTARLLPVEAALASALHGSADLPVRQDWPAVPPGEPAGRPSPLRVESEAQLSPATDPAPLASPLSPAPAVPATAAASPVPAAPAAPATAATPATAAASPAAPVAPATEIPAPALLAAVDPKPPAPQWVAPSAAKTPLLEPLPLRGPETLQPAPEAGVEGPGASDPTWYSGRDLDVLPRPLAPIEPPFPINAQLRGVSGKVTLAVSIDAAGRVVAVDVIAADPAGFFEESARSAFRAARYAPGIKDGRAVHARLQTVVVFELGPR